MRLVAAALAVVVTVGLGTPAAAVERPTVRYLGAEVSRAEKQAYRCGSFRDGRRARGFVVERAARYRLVPRWRLREWHDVTSRCARLRPMPVPAPAPALPPPAVVEVPPPPPEPTVTQPTTQPAPQRTSQCGNEISDPTRPPVVGGLRPVNRMDAYDPSPDVRQATASPMDLWNIAPSKVTDDGHVRVTFPDGQEYRHPVASLNFALASLRQYRQAEDPTWLNRALTAYGDTIARATPGGQIPQEFPWPGPEGPLLAQPAYSAMTQGLALSAAARLYWITSDPKWRDLADRMFATLATPGTASPAVTFIDTDGYLWFEEFPLECPGRVWNGHVFATYAMADYYWLTGDERAADLFDAGATTALHYMPLIRQPGEKATYNLSFPHPVTDLWYHRMMTNQLRQLATVTGEGEFTAWADLLAEDEAVLREKD